MGAKWWQVKSRTRLKKCSERISNSCDPTETDGCCAVIPCRYCLEFTDELGTLYGTAEFTGSGWQGSVDGSVFHGYWERGYESGECEFVVTFDGEEIYRKSCYEGQSCRDSSDSTHVAGRYNPGFLKWIKQEYRTLEHHIDPTTGCSTFWCGDCSCTCQIMCIEVNVPLPPKVLDEYECCSDLEVLCTDDTQRWARGYGELAGPVLKCDGPDWSGGITARSLPLSVTCVSGGFGECDDDFVDLQVRVSLTRSLYTNECILSGSMGEDELEPVVVGDCKAISHTWTLYDGSTVAVNCKVCECENPDDGGGCDEVAGCCAKIPCTMCLEFETAYATWYGVAEFTGSGWSGTVYRAPFLAYWERGYDGECEFVVTVDGIEVFRQSQYAGQSCIDPGGSVQTVINGEQGTLRWITHLFRKLEPRLDDDGNKVMFCGDCEFTCECLCVTITDASGLEIAAGEICDTAYPCDAPVWAGSVGGRDISLEMGHDAYGNCVIIATIDGEPHSVISVAGCDNLYFTIELDNYETITFSCKLCDCDGQTCETLCLCEISLSGAGGTGEGDSGCSQVTLTSAPDECAGSGMYGVYEGPATLALIDPADRAWTTDDEVLFFGFHGFHITIPCNLMPLGYTFAVVRRGSVAIASHREDVAVDICEYYLVVYEKVNYTIVSITYEFDICCARAVAIANCETRTAWVEFFNIAAGRGTYSALFWAGENGVLNHCGRSSPCPL